MTKTEILKELYIMVQKCNYNAYYGLGIRCETSENRQQRSKDIRAFLVDLFDGYSGEHGELLHMLESAIDENVHGNGNYDSDEEEELPFPTNKSYDDDELPFP